MKADNLFRRVGRNQGAYRGETVEMQTVLRDIEVAALGYAWRQDCFLHSEALCLHAYHQSIKKPAKRVYISAGIHGDEPAGPLAVRELILRNRWPDAVEVWLCPCLNPTGFALNRRENMHGLDLNRQYLHLEADETKAHVAWLEQQPSFDVALCLHEDWEAHGFYVYELNPDAQSSFAEMMVRSIADVCPIDLSPVIEGREAAGGIIRPSADPSSRPQWPEAFYLLTHKTRLSYTLEAPSDFPMSVRVAALVTGVHAVLERLSS